MAQHDLDLANASGSSFRADANNALQALGSTMKGPNAPSSPVAGMMWVEDDNPSSSVWTLRQYDGTDWIALGTIDTNNNRFLPTGLFDAGSAGSPSFAPAGDSNTGMWAPAADTLAWSTGGSERLRIDSSGFLSLAADTDTGLSVPASNFLALTAGGTERLRVGSAITVDSKPNWLTGLGAAPLPISGSGLGQITILTSSAPGNGVAMPSGGTWVYVYLGISSTNDFASGFAVAFLAGAATVAGSPGVTWTGFAWRIT